MAESNHALTHAPPFTPTPPPTQAQIAQGAGQSIERPAQQAPSSTMAGRSAPSLKPISTRTRDDVERASPATSSTPKARGAGDESPGLGSDSSSPWRRFFRGGSRYAGSDMDSFGTSPRNLMGFSPKAGGSQTSQSHVSSPKRPNRYGSGQINAYPPTNAAGAVMMSLAEELLTKKGLSLKDLHGEQEEYADSGDKVGGGRLDGGWTGGLDGGGVTGSGTGSADGAFCCMLTTVLQRQQRTQPQQSLQHQCSTSSGSR